MSVVHGQLLELVCRRILDLEVPAYVKDSALRYVAVNSAYASLFGLLPSEFIGLSLEDVTGEDDLSDLGDKERRALVFGAEEVARPDAHASSPDQIVRIERFFPDDNSVFIFAQYEEPVEAAPPVSIHGAQVPAFSPADHDLQTIRHDLENLALPIGIFAQDGRPLVVNAAFRDRESGATAEPAHNAGRPGDPDLLRSFLEELPVAVFIRDSRHRMVFANSIFSELMDLSPEECMGKTEIEAFGHEGKANFDVNERILMTGALVEREETMIRRDGTRVQVLSRLSRLIDGNGEAYVVCSITDITALKQQAQDLIDARLMADAMRQDVATVLQNLPIGILILDADYNIDYMNDGLATALGLPEDTPFTGTTMRDFVAYYHALRRYATQETDLDVIYDARVAALNDLMNKGPVEYKSSSGRSTLMSSTRLSDGKLLITYSDLSALRDQERIVRFLHDATRVMSQGFLVIEHGAIVLSNPAVALLLDIPAEMLSVGSEWIESFRFCDQRGDFGDEAETIYATLTTCIAQKQPISIAFMAAGRTYVQLEGTFNGLGQWMIVLSDLTEMKRREGELTRLLERSEAADRAKSEFLANMSHEIRTPMNGVLGMTELLAKTDLDSRQRAFVEIIGTSGHVLLTILNDILDFSKLDAGEMTLRNAPFDPVDAVEDVATLLTTGAAEKDIEMMVRVADDLPRSLIGDAGRFRQIITSLAGNAVKFTEKGHILLDVSFEGLGPDEIELVVAIQDTGMGIPPGQITAIFERFSQVDTTSTRRHEGTGLGLAKTAGLVALFRGTIDVTSDVGQGSIFTVRLPLSVGHCRREIAPAPVSVRGARVLVIDDNAVNRQILMSQMERWGFDACAAESGEEGFGILDAAHEMGVQVDAIVLDYHMPGMNGLETAALVRSASRFDTTAIVFLTSMNIVGGDAVFEALHVQAHLMKPARSGILLNTLVDVVRSARLARRNGTSLIETARYGHDRSEAGSGTEADAGALSAAPEPRRGPYYDVIVAEDNEVNRIVFQQILQATGLRFLIVNDGQQAVEAWRVHRPGLVLMDISMPVMDGHQATRAIRALEAEHGDARVPIVAVTAHAIETELHLCIASGMDDYLPKPISPELLEGKIQRWLPRKVEDVRGQV